MINFFYPVKDDASIAYLSQIFGNMGGVLNGDTITLLGTICRTLNGVALTIAALIVTYVMVMGVMMTSHEGEVMKKWHNIWTPIRVVIGIASLIPTVTGYSTIQIVMMWVIVQGVGVADILWNTVLGSVSYMGSAYAQVDMGYPGVDQNINGLFRSLVCDETLRATYSPPDPTIASGGYFCGPKNTCFERPLNLDPAQKEVNSYSMGPGGACGSITYCSEETQCADDKLNSLECLSCKAQKKALVNIITTLRQVADIYVKADYDYQHYYYAYGTEPNLKQPGWVGKYCDAKRYGPDQRKPKPAGGALLDPNNQLGDHSAKDTIIADMYYPYAMKEVLGDDNPLKTMLGYYGDAQSTVLVGFVANQTKNNTINDVYANAQKTGWIFAGAYYYTLTQSSTKNLNKVSPFLQGEVGNPDANAQISPYRNNAAAAEALVNAMNDISPSNKSKKLLSVSNQAMDQVNDMMQTVTTPSDANPLVQLATAGYALLISVIPLFTVFLTMAIALGIAGGVNIWVLGEGGLSWGFIAALVAMMILVPLTGALLGLIVSMGGLLGVYVPLIPYIVFTFGAIGWLTATIETIVAGPLVALGIITPGGRHEFLGTAEPALMLLFYVFIRPALMIFGLVAAMLLAMVVVKIINLMFGEVMYQIMGAATGTLDTSSKRNAGNNAAMINPIELAFFLVAYVGLIVSAMNKCFSAIHVIPERVVAWIGGHAGASYGEAHELAEAKHGIESATSTVGGGLEEGLKEATEKAEELGYGKRVKRDKKEKSEEAEIAARAIDEDNPEMIGPKRPKKPDLDSAESSAGSDDESDTDTDTDSDDEGSSK